MLLLALVIIVVAAALVADVFATLPSRPLMSSDALADSSAQALPQRPKVRQLATDTVD